MAVDKRYEFHLAAGSGHHHSSCWRSWISKVSGIVGIPKLGAFWSFNWMGYLVMWTYRFPVIYITCQCGLILFFFCFVFSNSFRLVPSALTSCRGSFSPLSLLSSISLIGGRTFSSKTKTIEDALLANWRFPGHLILYLFIYFSFTHLVKIIQHVKIASFTCHPFRSCWQWWKICEPKKAVLFIYLYIYITG